jgi:hypothetical protein
MPSALHIAVMVVGVTAISLKANDSFSSYGVRLHSTKVLYAM